MAFDITQKEDPDLRSETECFPDIDPGIEVAGDRVLSPTKTRKS